MDTETPPGLREKKRAETRALLEKAAVDLVISDGLEHATIEAISERAFVSLRTFFNYFDSKEDAILGIRDVEITEEDLPGIVGTTGPGDLVASVVRVLYHTMAPALENRSLHSARKQAIQRYPQLLGRHMSQMFRMNEQLTTLTASLMQHDPGFATASADECKRFAGVLFMLCASAVRSTVHESAERGDIDSAHDSELRATALVREVIGKLR